MSGERTEAPTPRRVSDARAEGRVARSMELSGAAGLLAGVWLLQIFGQQMVEGLKGILSASFQSISNLSAPNLGAQAGALLPLIPSLVFILLGVMVTGVSVNFAQTGLLWASKRIGFDFTRLNPLTGLKRIFSLQGLVEMLKALLKLLIVGWMAYTFLRDHATDMLTLGQTDLPAALLHWTELATTLGMRVGMAYIVLALADYGYQRWQYMKNLRMTKEEVKEDFKRSEGDPFIRAHIRAQQRRMVRMRMMEKVPKADVVITNPTHLAVAVQYNSQEMRAPKVLAKGAHHVAERIVEIARSHKIPVVQNIPVARALFHAVDIDQEIPPELYVALAEVLAYVYKLRGKVLRRPQTVQE